MTLEMHTVTRAADTSVALANNSVAKIVHKDGSVFAGKACVAHEDGALVVTYADGTSVTLTL